MDLDTKPIWSGRLISAFLLLPVALILIYISNAQRSTAPQRVQATVTNIRPADDAYHAMVWITAQASTGVVGSKAVPLQDLRCELGDTIEGELRGLTLSLNERSCRRAS